MKKKVVKFIFIFSFLTLISFWLISLFGLGNTVISRIESTKAASVDLDQSWTLSARDFHIKVGKGGEKVLVLLYHRIVEDSQLKDIHYEDGELISTIVPASKFEEQLKYLKDNDYTVLTSLELEKFIDGELEVPKKRVVFTFDDARKEDSEVAYKLLKKYQFNAVNFGLTGETTKFTKDYDSEECLYMSKSELEECSDIFEFQSHTHNMHSEKHPLLNSSKEGIIDDLNESYRFLNLYDGRKIFSYPYSDYNKGIKAALKEVGVSMAFVIGNSKVNHETDKLEIPRYSITPDLDLNDFIYLVTED